MTEATMRMVDEDISHQELATKIFFLIPTRKGIYLSIDDIEKKLLLRRIIKYIKRSIKCQRHTVFYTQEEFLKRINLIVKITGFRIQLSSYQAQYGPHDD
jgi:hypothetical protein